MDINGANKQKGYKTTNIWKRLVWVYLVHFLKKQYLWKDLDNESNLQVIEVIEKIQIL